MVAIAKTPAKQTLIMPFDEPAEGAFLGAMLYLPEMFPSYRTSMEEEDFFLLRHRYIWQAMVALEDRKEPIDYLTVKTQLEKVGQLTDIGGAAYLTHLVNEVPILSDTPVYGKYVRQLRMRRDLIVASQDIYGLAMNTELTTEEAFRQSEMRLLDVTGKDVVGDVISIQQTQSDIFDVIEERMTLAKSNPNYRIGICSGFYDLDQLLDGFQNGDVNTIAAATGVGKTAFLTSVVLNAAQHGVNLQEQRGAHILMFSGEMTEQQLQFRMLSCVTGIQARVIKRGTLTEDQYKKVLQAQDQVSRLPIHFYRQSRMDTMTIRVICKQLQKRGKLDLLVLDGLLQLDQSKTERDNWAYLMGIMNQLEDIAVEQDIPILLSHQINRNAGNRTNKRPHLADLGYSAAVEQKSARVLFLHRESYWGVTHDDNGKPIDESLTELIVAKNRHGGLSTIKLRFDRQSTRYRDWS